MVFGKWTVVSRSVTRPGYWQCRCECGNEKEASGYYLRKGNSPSCGCLQRLNLDGKKFGKWTVIGESECGDQTKVKCRCDCGVIRDVYKNNLRRGMSNSCGCGQKTDLTGKRVGRLAVKYPIHKLSKNGTKTLFWVCDCDCGKQVEVASSNLHNQTILSCGCYRSEYMSKKQFIHGYGETRIYASFRQMHRRCGNPKSERYGNYGGRGIKVCEEWDNFEPFLKWAMANGYTDDLTIDRIDINGPYAPWNCRWVDMSTQANNKQDTIYLTLDGKTQPLTVWARELGIPRRRVYKRYRWGWSPEKILSEEIFKGGVKPKPKEG